jgi:hypothetical protein
MRLPIILALIVVITLPKDVQGLVNDVSHQMRVAQATIGKMLHRDDTIQVAEAKISTTFKSQGDTTKGLSGNLR